MAIYLILGEFIFMIHGNLFHMLEYAHFSTSTLYTHVWVASFKVAIFITIFCLSGELEKQRI